MTSDIEIFFFHFTNEALIQQNYREEKLVEKMSFLVKPGSAYFKGSLHHIL